MDSIFIRVDYSSSMFVSRPSYKQEPDYVVDSGEFILQMPAVLSQKVVLSTVCRQSPNLTLKEKNSIGL